MRRAKIPVTVITGFLGAGKTTLLNRLLTGGHDRRHAVIVNEFGSTGIDGALILAPEARIVELSNGCLCCIMRDDLREALTLLLAKPGKLDGIYIETSGLAAPGPVAQVFMLDDDINELLRLRCVATVVDALNFEANVAAGPEAAEQIAFADILLLSKLDLVAGDRERQLRAELAAFNPHAELRPADGFDPDWEAQEAPGRPRRRTVGAAAHPWPVRSVCLESEAPLDTDAFLRWIRTLLRREGPNLLRAKGIVAFAGEARRFVFHGVQTAFDGDVDRPWRRDEPRLSRMVFIGRNLDEARIRREFDMVRLGGAAASPSVAL